MQSVLKTVTGALAGLAGLSDTTTYHLSSDVVHGLSNVDYIAKDTHFNAPHMHPVNSSSYDLWYWDAVSTDPSSNASVVIAFFDVAPGTFPIPPLEGTNLIATIATTFANGSLTFVSLPATSATVIAQGQGVNGDWHGTGLHFTYDPASGAYDVHVDAPEHGVKGVVHFARNTPPRYTCGPATAGTNMQIFPGAGYANAMPDSVVTVDLMVNGTPLKFEGAGYQDQGWGPVPFLTTMRSWYWGHGRVGPYSVVWFDVMTPDGTEFVSAYASKGEDVITLSCDPGSTKARPRGDGTTFPPNHGGPKPSGYDVTLSLGAQGILHMDVTVVNPILTFPYYMRAVSYIDGFIVAPDGTKGEMMGGVAFLEEFTLPADETKDQKHDEL
ncbi:Hydroxyneurosporene synthase [Favolaschia claudopus]|uniref:Hydroxyneurosporene synthase n=1 Tax=Favolaschia claudopus TaxID=2862362 RepID=A0AAW0EA13_9AGAR